MFRRLRSGTDITACLLASPSGIQSDRREKVTALHPEIGTGSRYAVNSHRNREIAVYRQSDQRIQLGVSERFPPIIIHRKRLLKYLSTLLPFIRKRRLQVTVCSLPNRRYSRKKHKERYAPHSYIHISSGFYEMI